MPFRPSTIPFDDLNLIRAPLAADGELVAHHAAQPFTRFYGSVACDRSLEIVFEFANDETDKDGRYVTDKTLPDLHYDAEGLRLFYEPQKQAATGKFLVTIYGRWLRVTVKNTDKVPTEFLRCYVRGSVF